MKNWPPEPGSRVVLVSERYSMWPVGTIGVVKAARDMNHGRIVDVYWPDDSPGGRPCGEQYLEAIDAMPDGDE